jgi:4-amino-4-deoxy-L-arabinose transferase-like glycosyltransferase
MLAVPYLVAIASLRGLTVALPTFHGVDEYYYHYPVILRFAHQLPFPDVTHYAAGAAQPPLFHLVMAYIGKVIGYELWRLRLLEALISYAAVVVLFVLLKRRLGLDRGTAVALALLFALSPYIYGASFRLLTDNLAILFTVVALERFERFREAEELGPFVVGCLSVAAAMLTRQSTAFLVGVATYYALRGRPSVRGSPTLRDRTVALSAVGASAVPLIALFVAWHGLVPPTGNAAPCGLCSGGEGSTVHLVVTELALAALGLYGAVLFAPLLLKRIQAAGLPTLSELRGPLLGAACGVLLLLLWPAGTPTGSNAQGAGFITRVASHLPSLVGSSLVFWALVPAAGAVLWARLRVAPRRWLVLVFLGCFLVSTLVIRFPWQKYIDPFVLLAILLTVSPGELVSRRDFAGAGVLAVGFTVYILTFVG